MNKTLASIGAGLILLTIDVFAQQQAVTTSGGSLNAVPKFSGTTTVVNSAIYELNGNVGIGTQSPNAKSQIGGDLLVSASGIGTKYGQTTLYGGAGLPALAIQGQQGVTTDIEVLVNIQ